MDKKKLIALYLSLAAAALFVYWPVQTYSFINFDDPIYILNNSHIKNGLNLAAIKWAFSSFYAGNWHPLTWISHIIDWQIYGDFAGGHHRTNLILHIANSLLLFTFLLRAVSDDRRCAAWLPCFICAFLLAIHPVHVESVAWVSERKDVLCMFFTMLALLAYLEWVRSRQGAIFVLTHLLLVCALLAKPMAVTLPFLLLIIDFWPLRRFSLPPGSRRQFGRFIELCREKSVMFAICAILAIITFLAQQSAGAVKTLKAIPVSARLENALSSYIQYILNMFWPTKLAVFYPFRFDMPIWAPIAGALLIFLLFISLRKFILNPPGAYDDACPAIISGALWFVVSLLPVIGLVQIGNQAYADRYMYIPAIGLYIIVAWGIMGIRNGLLKKTAIVLLGGGLIILTFVSRQQVATWSDSISLFQHALAVTRNNDTAHTYLANAYRDQGQSDLAALHYKKALAINPSSIEALINFGALLASSANQTAAGKIFERAVALYPGNPEAHNNLANIMRERGELEEAVKHYKIAIKLKPDYQNALFNLAATYNELGRFDQAAARYRRCLELNGDFAAAHNGLGIVLARQGRLDEAIAHFNRALAIAYGRGRAAKSDYDSARRNLAKAKSMLKKNHPETGAQEL